MSDTFEKQVPGTARMVMSAVRKVASLSWYAFVLVLVGLGKTTEAFISFFKKHTVVLFFLSLIAWLWILMGEYSPISVFVITGLVMFCFAFRNPLLAQHGAAKESTLSSGHYAKLEPVIQAFYAQTADEIVVDPKGRGVPDVLGKYQDGSPLVGEIKSSNEARGSTASWWSYWNKPPRNLGANYKQPVPDSPKSTAGWCAVIDGQLRAYVATHGRQQGELIVEEGVDYADGVERAMTFLQEEGRIASWTRSGSERGCLFWHIHYQSGE